MTSPTNAFETPVQQDVKRDTTQENIAVIRQKYERELAKERAEKEEALRMARDALSKPQKEEEDEVDDAPYVDRRKLQKELTRYEQKNKKETQSEIQRAVQDALVKERQQNWIKANDDFQEVMQHAEKLYQKSPRLAETILEMPEGFERQKLVYQTIKDFGLHKAPEKTPSIQDKIDQNRKTPYYQPTGTASAPYAAVGDFSKVGQKNAYDKMQELKNRLGGVR
jgi:hypothetical protein